MALNQNQFAQVPVLGMLDLKMGNGTTISCEIDSSEAGTLVAGQAVKLVDSEGGVPKVVASSSDADVVFGYIAYDIKDQSFKALDKVEVSTGFGNVMYMTATAAIARGAKLKGAVATVGGVATATGGSLVVGWAVDKGANSGDLIRVYQVLPSFFID